MITYSNTSKLIFSQGKDSSTINLKPKASQGASATEFKSVLDNTLKNTSKPAYDSKASHDDNKVSGTSDSKLKYKSFKDLEKNQTINSTNSSVQKTSGDSKSQKVDKESQELASDSSQYDEAINVLAQMLGLQPNELIKLANELGFSAEDLKNTKNLSLFTDKLASVLQLSDLQKNMLSTLTTEISKQVKTDSSLETVPTAESAKTVGTPAEANANLNTNSSNISEMADEVKAKLNQLIQNATINKESIGSEISKVIEAMKSQIQPKVAINTEQVTKDVTTGVSTEGTSSAEQLSAKENVTDVKESAKASSSKNEDNSKNTETADTKAAVDVANANAQVFTSNDQKQQSDQQNAQVFGDIKLGALNNQTGVQKTDFTMPQPVRNSEVLNQVVEQAKVVIGQDKSEMVIQLKPDHLGKLELKVVTEQGIVAAKFIAESQQVKEIIETNMQLLKDSLQKQGITVDSVNVQVGHDNQSEYQRQNSYQSSNNSSSNRNKYGSNESGIAALGTNALDSLPERLAQYANESNTINLTA